MGIAKKDKNRRANRMFIVGNKLVDVPKGSIAIAAKKMSISISKTEKDSVNKMDGETVQLDSQIELAKANTEDTNHDDHVTEMDFLNDELGRPPKPKPGLINAGKDVIRSFMNRNEKLYKSTMNKRNTSAFNKQVQSTSYNETIVFDFIESENINGLKEFLDKHHGRYVNCRSNLGYTPLLQAIRTGKKAIVKFLVKRKDVILYDALLHAILKKDLDIFELVYDKQLEVGNPTYDAELSDFPESLSPMMLASQIADFSTLKIFIQHYKITKLHPPNCYCAELCSKRVVSESLKDSQLRLDKFKSLASINFMCQADGDPILTALELSQELRDNASIELHFKKDYDALSEKCEQFVNSLVKECRNSREMNIILNQSNGYSHYKQGDHFARLLLALEYGHKRFVVNSNVQQVITIHWYGAYHEWKSFSGSTMFLEIIFRIFLLPFLFIMYNVTPNVPYCRKMRSPINKFLNFVASYLSFLILMYIMNELDVVDSRRGPPDTGIEVYLVMFVFGFIWKIVKDLKRHHPSIYFSDPWNIYIAINKALFLLTFLCWIISDIDIYVNGNVHLPREKWSQFDTSLISEAVFSCAYVFSFGLLMFFGQANSYFGPLQIALGYMVGDIFRFTGIFTLVCVAFAAGLYSIYYHYDGMSYMEHGVELGQTRAFYSMKEAMSTMYWAIYGYAPPNYADIVTPKTVEISGNSTRLVENPHYFTQTVGHVIFVIFYVICIITLINMLIAMMATSYSKVQENCDLEFKFNRTKMWSNYFHEGSTLPPPYNLFPSLKSIMSVVQMIINYFTQRTTKYKLKMIHRKQRNYSKTMLANGFEDVKYKYLVNILVQRYQNTISTSDQERAAQLFDINNQLDKLNLKNDENLIIMELTEIDRQNQMDAMNEEHPGYIGMDSDEGDDLNEMEAIDRYKDKKIRKFLKKSLNHKLRRLLRRKHKQNYIIELVGDDKWLTKQQRDKYLEKAKIAAIIMKQSKKVAAELDDLDLEIAKEKIKNARLEDEKYHDAGPPDYSLLTKSLHSKKIENPNRKISRVDLAIPKARARINKRNLQRKRSLLKDAKSNQSIASHITIPALTIKSASQSETNSKKEVKK